MIRHVVVFAFGPTFTPEIEESWATGVAQLTPLLRGLRSLTLGKNVLLSARAYDYAIVADFDSLDDVAAYTDHEAHRALIEISSAHADHIVSVDFELGSPEPAVAS